MGELADYVAWKQSRGLFVPGWEIATAEAEVAREGDRPAPTAQDRAREAAEIAEWERRDDEDRARIFGRKPVRAQEALGRVDERVRPGSVGAGRKPWSTLDDEPAPAAQSAPAGTSLSLEQARSKLVHSAVIFAGKAESAARQFADQKIREGWTAAQLVAFAELVWQEYGNPQTSAAAWEAEDDRRRAAMFGRRPGHER